LMVQARPPFASAATALPDAGFFARL
jgi:hypothetical protein